MNIWINQAFFFVTLLLLAVSVGVGIFREKRSVIPSAAMPEVGTFARERLVFLLLMAAALAVRLWKFGIVPGGMNQDCAMAAVDAKALLEYGTDRLGMKWPVHFTAWGYGQMSVLLSYCMIPFIKFFGMNAASVYMPSLFISMAGMAAAYFAAKRLFGVRTAQLALLLTAFNPWHFMQSRWALDCNLLPHVFVLGFLLLLIGFMGKRRYLYLSMVLFALCMYCYGVAFYTVNVFLMAVCAYALAVKAVRWQDAVICAGIYFVISGPIYLVMVINTLQLNTISTPWFTIPYFPLTERSDDLLFFAYHKPRQLYENVMSLLRVLREGDYFVWNRIEGIGAINLFLYPFAALGGAWLAVLVRKTGEIKKKVSYAALGCFLFVGLLAGVITRNANINRINLVWYPIIILAAAGLNCVLKNRRQLIYGLAPMFLIATVLMLQTYFTTYAPQVASAFHKEYIEAVQYLEDVGCNRLVSVTPIPEKVEIVVVFVENLDAKYMQGEYSDEDGLYYSEKYRFRKTMDGIRLERGVGYIVQEENLSQFDPTVFEIRCFGEYYSLYQK